MVELEHIGDGDHQIEELGLKAAPLIGEGFELLGQLQQLELGEPVPLLKGAAPGTGGWAPLAEEGQQSAQQLGEVLKSQGSLFKGPQGFRGASRRPGGNRAIGPGEPRGGWRSPHR